MGKLAEPDPGRDVGHVELAADELDLHAVAAAAHDPLEAVLLRERRLALVVEDQAAAFGGRDVLVRVKADRHEIPEGPDPPALPGASEGLRGVLHHPQAAPPGDGVQPVAVDGEPGQVDRQDRPGARRHGRLDPAEVDRARGGVDVDEDGPRPHLEDDVARGDPGERCRHHLVAGPDARDPEGDLHRAGPRVEGPHRPAAEVLRKPRLERLHLGPGGDPSRAQHLRDAGDRGLVDRRAGEGKVRLGRLHRFLCDGGRGHGGGHSAGRRQILKAGC